MLCFDGKNMTFKPDAELSAEELEAAQAARLIEQNACEELTDEKKLSLFLASIPTQDTPSAEPKLGYKWQPMYSSTAGFAWELVEDPTALGTKNNPWYWVDGMTVKMGHHYTTDGAAVYIALEDGVPPAWADADWFMEA